MQQFRVHDNIARSGEYYQLVHVSSYIIVFSTRTMKKMLIPVVAAGLLLALSSVSATALARGGCDDLLGDMQCAGGEGSKGGGGGGLFKCTDTDCFSGYHSGGSGGRNHRNSDGTISPGGEGGRYWCNNDVENSCRLIGGSIGLPPE